MNTGLIPQGMWLLFRPSFQKHLSILGVEINDRSRLMKTAKCKYKEILSIIPRFEKEDILLVNILSAAMLAAVYMSISKKPSAEQMTEYYETSMNESMVMKFVLKHTDNFTQGYQNRLKRDAAKSQKAKNPYTWRYEFIAGPTLDSFDAIFDKCGICNLMKDLGIPELTESMCAYDYGMAKHTNTLFTREYTLASGGLVCDCHYRKRK